MDLELGSVGFYTPSSRRSRASSTIEKISKFNLTLIGDSGVGKTSLLYFYRYNQFPKSDYFSKFSTGCTISPFKTKVGVNGQVYNVRVLDTNGLPDPDDPEYHREGNCFILCYSLTSKSSFESVNNKWFPKLREAFPTVPVVVAGLKADCKISETIFKDQLETIGGQWSSGIRQILRCSAKSGTGIEYVFLRGIQTVLEIERERRRNLWWPCFWW